MRHGETVVLQENDGRDMCCVISSLTQILLDPYFRTTCGFESLIQKDWVSLGHPFSDRLGHVINNDTTERSPLLLLFLDCTWQLLQQFPDEFEFSETFLTTLWDSAFLPIFDTFLFNSEHDRQMAMKKNRLVLRPVWDWAEQFVDKDLALFNNPLYKKPTEQLNNARKSMAILPSNAIPLPGLHKTGSSRFSLNVGANQMMIAQQRAQRTEVKPFGRKPFTQYLAKIQALCCCCFFLSFFVFFHVFRLIFWIHFMRFATWKYGCSAIIAGCLCWKLKTVETYKSIYSIAWH